MLIKDLRVHPIAHHLLRISRGSGCIRNLLNGGMSRLGGMHSDRGLALSYPAALVASDDEVIRVGEVMVLVLELLAEALGALEQLLAFRGIPRRDVEVVFHLVLVEDLGDAVVVDVGPDEYTTKVVLALAVLYDGTLLRLMSTSFQSLCLRLL